VKQQIARLSHQLDNVNQFQALMERHLPFAHLQQMDAQQETQQL
jgi:hypothetical protein